jgi:hypothetical protein
MTPLNSFTHPIDLNTQCWLLAGCCALYPEEFASHPELTALRKAIQDKHRNAIAVALEVACSHLVHKLSRQQIRLARQLATQVRDGSPEQMRAGVMALSRASIREQRQAS